MALTAHKFSNSVEGTDYAIFPARVEHDKAVWFHGTSAYHHDAIARSLRIRAMQEQLSEPPLAYPLSIAWQ